MVRIGYHASHEQFAPSELLTHVKLAEQAGFDCAKSSDHFHPWSERQGQSGFAWSWLGSAMEATHFPIGMISAPGYRYHPAILAQAAATVAEMYPDRLWLALGSGEAINEAITGAYWPDKGERNARLLECVEVIRALLAGETVTHRGRVTVVEAKLYSRPASAPNLLGAAVTEATARWCAKWADGLLIACTEAKAARTLVNAYRDGGGSGKIIVQAALSWAATDAEAETMALDQWSACAAGGEVNWDLRRPQDFDLVSRFVTGEQMRSIVHVSSDLSRITGWLAELAAAGADEIHLHQVGRNQREFISAFGENMLPQLRRFRAW
jgi:coenzyme F420-dependent glucose-6-phosphate dehydrogenase